MSGTESTFAGKMNEIAGKAKQAFGEATHNESLANEGAAQQLKAHAEEAWGSIQSAATETKTEDEATTTQTAHDTAHDIREKIVSTAQNVKEHIQAGVDSYRNDHKD